MKIKKTFIPKSLGLTEVMLERLSQRFVLSEKNLNEIRYWNAKESPHSGTVIDVEGEFVCFPFLFPADQFKVVYPDGEVWGEASHSQPVSTLDWNKERATSNLCGYCTGSPPGNSCSGSCFTRTDWMAEQVPRHKLEHLKAELRAMPGTRLALDLREAQLRTELEGMEKKD